ncbi:MAG: DUF3754 domain-containing protein [Treponema sp.]|nr:DUF3754 domain-containing protein [Treponema sp.]
MEDLDEEARNKRKAEQIAYRNKKNFSSIFMVIATLAEIAITFILVIGLLIIGIFILSRICDIDSQAFSNSLGVLVIVISLVGLVVGFIIYKQLMRFVIKKFKLESKLSDEILFHYVKNYKEQKAEREKELKE